ncbi:MULTISPECIES: glutaminase [Dietzia]|uniref:Glutaminase n=1 Tax=Dietzia cinnamea TaxID=321318 RepID=A0ABV3YFZ0_9ACTN|nr:MULTISPECIES: glutaminase [Dietzia]KZO58469.1 glutaminase [Dietzia maris]AVM63914.1 glutaminase [Dietzia sp. oral taxon 368]MCT1885042.1 glutaminase [Dietzia cinnamea]MCT2057580.1 glutaminase [Dietzia cinnamea]MCT2060532.1 glutaminase [Dietzia cinnamea]
MKTPVPDYLLEIRDACSDGGEGRLADYIPELAAVDPDRFAVAACMIDGVVYTAGDADAEFTIQSMSKPFVYALALRDRGIEAVLEKVEVEPSGDAFNQISLNRGTGRPRNPMINIGAIATHTLVGPPGASEDERNTVIADGLSAFAGRRLEVDGAVCESELRTAFRNRAMANLVRAGGIIDGDPDEALRGYTRQCAYRVTVRDLAVMAVTLATGGVNPVTRERVVSAPVVRQVLAVMTTCGMYDAAGDWMSTVGIPAKSGVSGGILGALPGQVGLGVFSPRLDEHGHSVEGVRAFERLSRELELHLMNTTVTEVEAVRSVRFDEISGRRTFRLQGPMTFASAEQVLRRLAEIPEGPEEVTLDLSRVSSVNASARRMLLEAMRRLADDGHTVGLADPSRRLPEPDLGDGTRPVTRRAAR